MSDVYQLCSLPFYELHYIYFEVFIFKIISKKTLIRSVYGNTSSGKLFKNVFLFIWITFNNFICNVNFHQGGS